MRLLTSHFDIGNKILGNIIINMTMGRPITVRVIRGQ